MRKKKHFVLPQGKGVGERDGYCKSINKQLLSRKPRRAELRVCDLWERYLLPPQRVRATSYSRLGQTVLSVATGVSHAALQLVPCTCISALPGFEPCSPGRELAL